ncbi:MAG: 2-oxoglutarate dehydrogenase E1 component [Bacteroidota bacterium]|nr:2-oxoglutarate dehydrogenase E1 component [Bacteroidota bacterium]
MDLYSYLGNSEIGAIEEIYQKFLKNPDSLDKSWHDFFKGFEFARANFNPETLAGKTLEYDKEVKVLNLIEGYRRRGHLFTLTNPVRNRRKYLPTLGLENFGLSEADMDTVFQAGKDIGIGPAPLKNIIEFLQQTYCLSIGAEYLYIRDPRVVKWLQDKMESTRNTPNFSTEEKKHFYNHLVQAVGFEQFIHKKFVGQKRFSLEGAESTIPALNAVIEKGSELGIEEFIIGMAHRGRLNVLTNILKKPYEDIFREFAAINYDEDTSLGDVKYHLGYNNTICTDSGREVKLNLVPNPSHLETVGPVVQGIARAKIRKDYNRSFNRLAAIIIHGDAAIAAQGVVYETIQMSQLDGYKTDGTIHIVINNQVGFTTNYLEARSSTYCTDVAKVTLSPVFHVNGDDVEGLIYTVKLAMEFRQTFHRDVFIDILCYRRYGHNEGDEPRFTQPLLYKAINQHPNPRDVYKAKLIKQDVLSVDEARQHEKNFDELLEQKLELAQTSQTIKIRQFLKKEWEGFRYAKNGDVFCPVNTAIPKELLLHLANQINHLPPEKKFFAKVHKIVEDRREMVLNDKLDWALGELLAYATLMIEGHPVRLSGQDSERGTFSHRHAAFVLEDSDQKYFPLKSLIEKKAPFHVFNSLLSEYATLGFEYGYACAMPNGLNIWEAQFGDFHNVAQVIIDQYISSAEEKWGLMNGLVMYLPHGYEGQGPEHSSARIERFLTLCAKNNIQVAVPSTPANLFHLLRRQIIRDFRLPLIIFTPKSLLRNPKCTSAIKEFSENGFQEIIDDNQVYPLKVTQIICCYGKLYYELLDRRSELKNFSTAIIRVEQLYPFPAEQLTQIIRQYTHATRWVWAQEEPENMGAWSFVQRIYKDFEFLPICRPASGSPAAGLVEIHKMRQKKILDKAFLQCNCERVNLYCNMQCDHFRTSDLALDLEKK